MGAVISTLDALFTSPANVRASMSRAAVTMVNSPGSSETAALSQFPVNRSVSSVSDISAASLRAFEASHAGLIR
jgi:hypothetical protein